MSQSFSQQTSRKSLSKARSSDDCHQVNDLLFQQACLSLGIPAFSFPSDDPLLARSHLSPGPHAKVSNSAIVMTIICAHRRSSWCSRIHTGTRTRRSLASVRFIERIHEASCEVDESWCCLGIKNTCFRAVVVRAGQGRRCAQSSSLRLGTMGMSEH